MAGPSGTAWGGLYFLDKKLLVHRLADGFWILIRYDMLSVRSDP